jgi:hypothetical protein
MLRLVRSGYIRFYRVSSVYVMLIQVRSGNILLGHFSSG